MKTPSEKCPDVSRDPRSKAGIDYITGRDECISSDNRAASFLQRGEPSVFWRTHCVPSTGQVLSVRLS